MRLARASDNSIQTHAVRAPFEICRIRDVLGRRQHRTRLTTMLVTREQNHNKVGRYTIHMDCSGSAFRSVHDGPHLFSDLPIHTMEAGTSERERLIADDEDELKGPKPRALSCEERIPKLMLAVSSVVFTLALIGAVVAVAILFRRVNDTMSSVDGAVSFHRSASNIIRNVDTLLNTSAQIAGTVHHLGLKGLDASIFSAPYLTEMLNTTTNLIQDVHHVIEHPSIQIGG